MRRTVLSLVVGLLVVGCREKPAQPNAPPASTSIPAIATSAPPVVSPKISVESRFECKTNADCTNSCRHGAVNEKWWERSYPGDEGCEDGCTSKGTDPPRCESGRCAAYAFGKPAKECTLLENDVLPGPGPAHRCSAPADCMTSCRYGAVNKSWYALGTRHECKDGCAGDGSEAARCEGGACVAYNEGARDASCTRRSVHTTD